MQGAPVDQYELLLSYKFNIRDNAIAVWKYLIYCGVCLL